MPVIKPLRKGSREAIAPTERRSSSLTDFVKRPLPSAVEVEAFEEAVGEEKRQQEIENDLLEIYDDGEGRLIDVKTISIRKKSSLISRLFSFLLVIGFFAGIAYGLYYYLSNSRSSGDNLEISITAPKAVSAGEEFFYTIDYRNVTASTLRQVRLELNYPENFIFIDSSPVNPDKSNWVLPDLAAYGNGSIKVKGKIMSKEGSDNVLIARAAYYLDNYSTQFKKEASASVSIKDVGFDISLDYVSSALIGEENTIAFNFSNMKNLIPEFNLTIALPDNFTLSTSTPITTDGLKMERIKDGVWHMSGFDAGAASQSAAIRYRVKEKRDDKQPIAIRFEAEGEANQIYSFYEKSVDIEVIKSDLSLSLELNGSKSDQAANFEDTLNYILYYANKGNVSMKNIVLSVAVNGSSVNWSSLKDRNSGERHSSVITWTKDQVSALGELKAGEEGQIAFSVSVIPFTKDTAVDSKISAYGQYSIGNSDEFKENVDTSSNKIVTAINSNLNFKEEIRYFDENNVPVGSGPLPPSVGEKTSLKVYWSLTNDLHDLNEVQVEMPLAAGLEFDEGARTSAGAVSYDANKRSVIWLLGRLPASVSQANAEFSISLMPSPADANKIMVVGNGSTAKALDVDTAQIIERQSGPKTTKLEDDDIASMNNDGRIR
jgi:hypothetical protein